MSTTAKYPDTPDGRYYVVHGRLWRKSNPELDETVRKRLVDELMQARRDIASAMRKGSDVAEQAARSRVHAAKVSLGERGPVWWTDGADDYNQHLVANSPYADWFGSLSND